MVDAQDMDQAPLISVDDQDPILAAGDDEILPVHGDQGFDHPPSEEEEEGCFKYYAKVITVWLPMDGRTVTVVHYSLSCGHPLVAHLYSVLVHIQ